MESEIIVDSVHYNRITIKTHVLVAGEDICNVVMEYVSPLLQKRDIIFISEKAIACTQGRAIPMADIKPRTLAILLSKFVYKNPYGIGLRIPETMEMALRECGTLRILLAAAVSAVGKLLKKRGWFYIIAGQKAAGIDGPCSCTIPPYNQYVVLTPSDPEKVAEYIAKKVKVTVAVVDINDLGGKILGCSDKIIDKKLLVKILKDNPLGQSSEQTPIGIIRKTKGL